MDRPTPATAPESPKHCTPTSRSYGPTPTPPARAAGGGEDADADLLTAYPTGEDPGAPDWQMLLTGARDRIDLLDMSLWDVVSVTGVVDLLAAKAAAGCQIRIVIANPEAEWTERFHNVLLAEGARGPTR